MLVDYELAEDKGSIEKKKEAISEYCVLEKFEIDTVIDDRYQESL